MTVGNPESASPDVLKLLRLLIGGATNQVISQTLDLSAAEVPRRIRCLVPKFQAKSRAELLACIRELVSFQP